MILEWVKHVTEDICLGFIEGIKHEEWTPATMDTL
jgi:hypothetical protein